MKFNATLTNAIILASATIAFSSAQASTSPAKIAAFTASKTTNNISIKAKGWSDPAFGDMGWTHSSGWGKFTAKKGQLVNIRVVSRTAGVHPGISVWNRSKDDTAPDNYVVDHFYPQNANTFEKGAKDETTNQAIGDIVMKIAAYGYDQDGHSDYGVDEDGKKILTPPVGLNGLKDKIPGQVTLRFKAPKTGDYMFVVGGYNPAATVDTKAVHIVNTIVKVGP